MQKAKFQSINDDVSVSSNRTKRRSLKAGGGGNRAAWRIQILQMSPNESNIKFPLEAD